MQRSSWRLNGELVRGRLVLLLCVVLVHAGRSDDAAVAAPEWTHGELAYRVPVTVSTFGVGENDAPVHVRLNFTPMLGEGEKLDPGSFRVVEYDARTGARLGEAPCLFQPVDDVWPGPQPLNWQAPDDPAAAPNAVASSENPEHPVRALIERDGFWEAGSATPPWSAAIDLGEIRMVNAIMARPLNDGRGQHAPNDVDIEVATESGDGLTEGNWERVGGWKGLSAPYIFGMLRPVFFSPRPVRYVRAVIHSSTGQQPRLGGLDVYRPLWNPDERAEGRVSWIVPGRTEQPRLFCIYFGSVGEAGPSPTAVPERVAIIQEAEEAVNTRQPSGVSFGGKFDASASGPTTPNMLSVFWKQDVFRFPAGFAVTIPRTDAYTIAFRIRGNPGDHGLGVLLDGSEIYQGVFCLEGQDWNVVSLPLLTLEEGVHHLDFYMRLGAGGLPMDFDVVTLVNAAELAINQGLRAKPGAPEVRP